jgi:hypothetical protein
VEGRARARIGVINAAQEAGEDGDGDDEDVYDDEGNSAVFRRLLKVEPGRYCSPRHQPHFEFSFVYLNGIL